MIPARLRCEFKATLCRFRWRCLTLALARHWDVTELTIPSRGEGACGDTVVVVSSLYHGATLVTVKVHLTSATPREKKGHFVILTLST